MADAPGSPAGGSHDSGGEQSPRSSSNIREQDRFLPIANISRIMKKALPANGKMAKDAKDTVQECVSEFISFVTSEYVPPLRFVRQNVWGWVAAAVSWPEFGRPELGIWCTQCLAHRICDYKQYPHQFLKNSCLC